MLDAKCPVTSTARENDHPVPCIVPGSLTCLIKQLFRPKPKIYRQKRREGIIDGANGTVNTQRADVTQGSAYEIPSRPGAVNPNPPEYDVITDSTYEIPNQSGAVNRNPKKSDVTASVMSAYEIPRPATNKSHQLTREQSSNDIVHEYADFKLTSLIQI